MVDEPDPAPESWRIVVFTNMPGGMIYSLVNEIVRPLGHRVVGVVTSPGPKRRRSPTYLEVVAAVPPGVDVIVSNHPERWAAMLAPWRPDLIVSGGFPWRIPADVLALPRLGAINFHDALLPRHRGPNATGWAFRDGRHRDGSDHSPHHPGVRHRPGPGAGARPDYRRRRPSTFMAQIVDHAPDSSTGAGAGGARRSRRSPSTEPGDRGRAVRGGMADHRLESAGPDHSQPGA